MNWTIPKLAKQAQVIKMQLNYEVNSQKLL